LTATEDFDTGEPVFVVDAGTLTEPGQDNAEVEVGDSDTAGEGGICATGPGAGTTNINPQTGSTYATGDACSYWPFGEGVIFITDNLFAAAAGSLVDPAQTDVGEAYQMVYSTTVGNRGGAGWGLERTTADEGTDLRCFVVEVLDAEKRPIRISGATGEFVLFEVERPTLAAA
jgi:hypothetical protein